MARIYQTQDYLRIELSYTVDVAIDTAVIKYIDPDETEGEWVATVDELNKLIYYDLPSGLPLGIAGRWTVWSVATADDGRIIPGDTFKFMVYTEGT